MASGVHVVLVCKSDLAFLPLRESTVLQVAAERAAAAKSAPSLSVWVSPEIPVMNSIQAEIAGKQVPVGFESTLAEHIQKYPAERILLHDVQRPLTPSKSFDKVAEILSPSITRACPAHVVVDTLKVVDEKFITTGTVNRDQVSALSSPEGYWSAAMGNQTSGVWSFEVTTGSTEYVAGDQEALRIRESADVLLVESFLIWQTTGN
jgi:2-C-methyl-D-erythritol 4-phosphate cytidylyltransferase